MAYTNPVVTASGATFAKLQAGGISGHLELLITAQAPPLTQPILTLLRAAKDGNLEDTYRRLRSVVTEYLRGEPVAIVDIEANLKNVHTALAILTTLCAEEGVLIDANQGTLTSVATGPGQRRPKRTFP